MTGQLCLIVELTTASPERLTRRRRIRRTDEQRAMGLDFASALDLDRVPLDVLLDKIVELVTIDDDEVCLRPFDALYVACQIAVDRRAA